MKISQLKDDQIKEFCGIDDDSNLLDLYKSAAKNFIVGYTGLTDAELDDHEDLTLAYMVLINDMSFNRDYTVSRDTLNPTVETILGLYTRNNIA